jgi:hypothetical protein
MPSRVVAFGGSALVEPAGPAANPETKNDALPADKVELAGLEPATSWVR